MWNLLAYVGMRFAYFKGYEVGDKAIEFLVGAQGQAIRKAIAIIGGMVIGAVAATWVSISTAFKLRTASGKVFPNLQNLLDYGYPGLLTVLFIVFCWWLMSKKNMSPIKVMLLLVVIALVGVVAGFFNPGLSY